MIKFAYSLFNGISAGMTVFLIAAGVTLIFGILRVLNFAHGAFFMVGAYVAFSMFGNDVGTIGNLLLGGLVGGLVVGVLGLITEKLILTRLRDVDYLYVLIATFALLLVVTGGVKLIWGQEVYTANPPEVLGGSISVGGVPVPSFALFVMGVGFIAYILLEILVHRMWVGKLLQSLVADSWMIGLFGYNVSVLYAFTVVLACFLAGLAGGLLLPNQALSPSLGDAYILLGFVTCILGGLGSVRGAFVASLMLGLVESLATTYLNAFPGVVAYAAMVVVLLVRPQGLFGTADPGAPKIGWTAALWFTRSTATVRAVAEKVGESAHNFKAAAKSLDQRFTEHKSSPLVPISAGIAILAVVSLPLWGNPGLLFVAGLMLIEALFALSWHFLFNKGGVASFGHAAFYALGAYTVGLLLKIQSGIPFLLLLLMAAIGAAIVAAIVGLIALKRSSGIYLAILTMALAEICRIIIGYSQLLGRDDGISAIPRPKIDLGVATLDLSPANHYYWFICVATALMTGLIWWLSHNRFGRVLNAVHQDAERTAFIGVDIDWYRLQAFMVSAALAAVAGGLSAPWTEIVTPDSTNVVHSTAPMLNSLLGGLSSFWGPFVGAAAFTAINYFTRTLQGLSEVVIGSILLVIVIVAPLGVMGLLKKLELQILSAFRKAPDHAGETVETAGRAS